jgi:hypothetical protein
MRAASRPEVVGAREPGPCMRRRPSTGNRPVSTRPPRTTRKSGFASGPLQRDDLRRLLKVAKPVGDRLHSPGERQSVQPCSSPGTCRVSSFPAIQARKRYAYIYL